MVYTSAASQPITEGEGGREGGREGGQMCIMKGSVTAHTAGDQAIILYYTSSESHQHYAVPLLRIAVLYKQACTNSAVICNSAGTYFRSEDA